MEFERSLPVVRAAAATTTRTRADMDSINNQSHPILINDNYPTHLHRTTKSQDRLIVEHIVCRPHPQTRTAFAKCAPEIANNAQSKPIAEPIIACIPFDGPCKSNWIDFNWYELRAIHECTQISPAFGNPAKLESRQIVVPLLYDSILIEAVNHSLLSYYVYAQLIAIVESGHISRRQTLRLLCFEWADDARICIHARSNAIPIASTCVLRENCRPTRQNMNVLTWFGLLLQSWSCDIRQDIVIETPCYWQWNTPLEINNAEANDG